MHRTSKKKTKSKSRSPNYDAYSPVTTYKQNTSAFEVNEQLVENGLMPSRTKNQGISQLIRNGIPIHQMSDDDAQCAARFPQFSAMNKDDVLDLAESLGVNTSGMAKIDGCHVLHQMGIDTEHKVHSVLALSTSSSTLPSWNPSPKPSPPPNAPNPTFTSGSYTPPVPSAPSLTIPSSQTLPIPNTFYIPPVPSAPSLTIPRSIFDESEEKVNDIAPPRNVPRRSLSPVKPPVLQEVEYPQEVVSLGDVVTRMKFRTRVPSPQPSPRRLYLSPVIEEQLPANGEYVSLSDMLRRSGKKCRRSKVDGRKRDKKGRFCKKSNKIMKRK